MHTFPYTSVCMRAFRDLCDFVVILQHQIKKISGREVYNADSTAFTSADSNFISGIRITWHAHVCVYECMLTLTAADPGDLKGLESHH